MSSPENPAGSPYTPHTDDEVAAMLETVGVSSIDELFDLPDSIAYDGTFEIPARSEQEVLAEVTNTLAQNDDVTCFLGRGHYDHYVPAVVDDVAGRSEYLTSYTQYQPEASQGYLQALFEYQSIVSELTGLAVANCSLYDAGAALGEAATFADRVRAFDGDRILVSEQLCADRRSVLQNYADGPGLTVETYPMQNETVDVAGLEDALADDVVMIVAANPTMRGAIEPNLEEIGQLAEEFDAAFCISSDPIALSILQRPADVGADIVIGDASVLGLPVSFGMGLGLFATREEFVRQVPGRLVGATTDDAGNRAYALTLVTREQHIRRERATSNICTNQAWVALRAAIHAAWLGPDGLVDVARRCVHRPAELADKLDAIDGVTAPMTSADHFREFTWSIDGDATSVAQALLERGFAVHVIDETTLQTCVINQAEDTVDDFVTAVEEVLA